MQDREPNRPETFQENEIVISGLCLDLSCEDSAFCWRSKPEFLHLEYSIGSFWVMLLD
jgi:hypothetical protein